jgi:hypothetical protein
MPKAAVKTPPPFSMVNAAFSSHSLQPTSNATKLKQMRLPKDGASVEG